MRRVLLITVGGSHQPVVTAIKELQPNRIVFICTQNGSDKQVVGKESPCEIRRNGEVVERLPNIPTQLNLVNFDSEQDVILVEPDDLQDAYDKIRSVINTLVAEPGVLLQADYTGGTKTMSAALVLAALDSNCDLHLTTGQRTNITRIERGEATRRVGSTNITVQRTLDNVIPPYQQSFNYAAIDQEIRRLFQQPLNDILRTRCDDIRNLALAFEAWDKFDHQEALELLRPHLSLPSVRPLGVFLRKVIWSRSKIDKNFNNCEGSRGTGYEIVIDLLLNSERRARQQRFDDAVARLYRTLELLAQVQLKREYQIDTGDVDLNKLPETVRADFHSKNEPLLLDLLNAYELLVKLNDSTLGQSYQSMHARIKDALQIRNYSLMAHGFTPISQEAYKKFRQVVIDLISQVDGIDSNWETYQFPVRF